jgi:hypothetical protein
MPTRHTLIDKKRLALDARPDRLDLRDRPYRPPLRNLPARFPSDAEVKAWLPAYAKAGLILDQGADGACTGFGLAAAINHQRFLLRQGQLTPAERVSPAMLYQLARLYDEWPGEDYDGSSCRGALKGWHRHGVCRWDLWPYEVDAKGRHRPTPPVEHAKRPDDPTKNWDLDALGCTLGVYYRVDGRSVVDMQAALAENRVLYVSADVHEGWAVTPRKTLRGHDDLPAITPIATPKDPGGHAFALVGFNERGFVVQNSWGTGWGALGFALLPYEDWLAHGGDVWVFTLGVPRALPPAADGRPQRTPRFVLPSAPVEASAPARSGRAGEGEVADRAGVMPAREGRPGWLSRDAAYQHAVVLDRGFFVNNEVAAATPDIALDRLALERPAAWMATQAAPKLLVYVHGGLNSERASIDRIRALAPAALDAGIYPLFITWRTGGLETVGDIVQEAFLRGGGDAAGLMDWLRRSGQAVIERTDRLLETLTRGVGGALWGQMKTNAVRAGTHEQGGVRALVQRLVSLQARHPGLEIHLMGHSAGSLVLGPMLTRLHEQGLRAASLRLFAPACSAGFAAEHYGPALANGTLDPARCHLHVLSDALELDDSVGPYRKSLLYLVSRAFEDVHREPLIGMANCYADVARGKREGLWAAERLDDVKAWQATRAAGWTLQTLTGASVNNGVRAIKAGHGTFDNDVAGMKDALEAIAGREVRVGPLDY